MKKLSLDTLQNFDKDIISILSSQRLESYKGNIEQYYANRILAFRAGHKIAELEIYLRNKMDFCLRELVGEEWIKEEESLGLITQKGHTPLQSLSPSQILSSLMLGEIVGLINHYKIENYMLNLKDIDFKKYHRSNRNFFYIGSKKSHFSNVSKVNTALNLIRNIRNRAFHWENLLKVTIKDNGEIFPRITHKERGSTIGVMPDKILEFLDDLLDCIGNQVIKEFQDLEIKYRGK